MRGYRTAHFAGKTQSNEILQKRNNSLDPCHDFYDKLNHIHKFNTLSASYLPYHFIFIYEYTHVCVKYKNDS